LKKGESAWNHENVGSTEKGGEVSGGGELTRLKKDRQNDEEKSELAD